MSIVGKFLATMSILCCTAVAALAQSAITLPFAANTATDLGNGPTKVRMIAGNASIFTSQGSGVGSTPGVSTALTLAAVPTVPPCIGCIISGAGITSGTTVAGYSSPTGLVAGNGIAIVAAGSGYQAGNGIAIVAAGSGYQAGNGIAIVAGSSPDITLSAVANIPTSTLVAWGAACPSSAAGIPANYIQASVMAGYYIMYTQARVCAVSPGGPVNTLLTEPIFYEIWSGSLTAGNGIAITVP